MIFHKKNFQCLIAPITLFVTPPKKKSVLKDIQSASSHCCTDDQFKFCPFPTSYKQQAIFQSMRTAIVIDNMQFNVTFHISAHTMTHFKWFIFH